MDKNDKCPLCEKGTKLIYLESHTDNNIKYDLFDCSNCHVQHWSPLKNPGGVWYENDLRYANRNLAASTIPGIQHLLALKTIKKYGGEILDVGCGHGNFLAEAKRQGMHGVGIDFDRDGIETGKRTFGLTELYPITMAEYLKQNPNKKFDWVTFFDLFEHIDNHNEFIEEIKMCLKKGGRVAFSIPNRNGSRFILTSDLPPRHLTRWDSKRIKEYLERKGFEDIVVNFLGAPFHQYVLKYKWKYGKLFTWGLTNKALKIHAKDTFINTHGTTSYIPRVNNKKVELIKNLAKLKDIILFGIPGGIHYLIGTISGSKNCDLVVTGKLK